MLRAREIVIASLLLLCPPCTLESPSSTTDGRIPSADATTAAALPSSDVTTPVGMTSTDVSTPGTPPVTPPIQLPPPGTLPSVHVTFGWPATSTQSTNLVSADGLVATKDLATTVQPTPPVELPQPVELQNQTDVLPPLEPLPPVELPPPDELPVELPPPDELPVELSPPDELPVELPPPDDLPVELPPPDELPVELPPPDELPVELPPPGELPVELPAPGELTVELPLPDELPVELPPPDELPVELPPPDELPVELPPPDELPVELPPPDELPEFGTFTFKPVEFRLVEEIPSKTEESTPELQTMTMPEIITDPPNEVIKGQILLMPVLHTINTKPPNKVNKALLVLIPSDPVRRPPMEHLDMAPPVPFGSDTTSKDDTTNDTNSVYETVRVYGQVDFAVPAYRYAAPFVLGVVLFVTLGFTVALVRKSRGGSTLNKASCILLVAVATADMLTVTSAIFDLVHMYSASAANYGTLPRNSCRVMYVLERLSAIPHTASIWITTVLAMQRYICVVKPFYASRLISVTSSYAISGAAFVSAVLLHVCRFVDAHFEPVNITKTEFPNITIQTCDFKYADWITNPVAYEVAFAWTRVIIVQLIPCVLLVTFASMMIRSLYSSSKTLKHSKLGAEKKQSNRRLLTIFVVVVSLIVSVVELVTGVLLCIHAVSISIGTYLLDYVDLKIAAIGIDITLYVSYFCVFVIYCLMSRKFRNRMGTLAEMMTCTYMYKTIRRRYRTLSARTKERTCGGIKSDSTQMSIEATCSNLSDNGTHLKHSESAATRTTIL